MENNNQFKLIQGEFNIQDSTSLVLSFFNTKITFHNQQLLKMAEEGKDDGGVIEQKITSLKLTKKAIIDFISSPTQSNPIFEIEGSITIRRQI